MYQRNIKHVILDIDHTMLHAVLAPDAVGYTFFLRPKLYAFLDMLFTYYYVGIFTAGTKEYAETVVTSFLQPYMSRLSFVMHRGHYEECKMETGGLKDLRYVQRRIPSFSPESTVIIDDCPGVKMTNGSHCIHVKQFYAGHTSDRELLRVWEELRRLN